MEAMLKTECNDEDYAQLEGAINQNEKCVSTPLAGGAGLAKVVICHFLQKGKFPCEDGKCDANTDGPLFQGMAESLKKLWKFGYKEPQREGLSEIFVAWQEKKTAAAAPTKTPLQKQPSAKLTKSGSAKKLS